MTTATRDAFFLDTNILLTATDAARETHHLAQEVFAWAASHGVSLFASGQVLREYLVVATRPAAGNGLGLSPGMAADNVEEFRSRMSVLDETGRVSTVLVDLVRESGISGKKIHDANVVATMLVHGIPTLLTQNLSDFTLMTSIETLDLVRLHEVMTG